MSVEQHDLVIVKDFLADGARGECSCGHWESPLLDDEATVVDAWENHCERVFMEATGG